MANSANPEINKKIATSALGTLFIATVFFYLGDRYAETLVTYPGQIFDHLGDAMRRDERATAHGRLRCNGGRVFRCHYGKGLHNPYAHPSPYLPADALSARGS